MLFDQRGCAQGVQRFGSCFVIVEKDRSRNVFGDQCALDAGIGEQIAAQGEELQNNQQADDKE